MKEISLIASFINVYFVVNAIHDNGIYSGIDVAIFMKFSKFYLLFHVNY